MGEGLCHVQVTQMGQGAATQQYRIDHVRAVVQGELLFVDRIAHAQIHQHHRTTFFATGSPNDHLAVAGLFEGLFHLFTAGLIVHIHGKAHPVVTVFFKNFHIGGMQ